MYIRMLFGILLLSGCSCRKMDNGAAEMAIVISEESNEEELVTLVCYVSRNDMSNLGVSEKDVKEFNMLLFNDFRSKVASFIVHGKSTDPGHDSKGKYIEWPMWARQLFSKGVNLCVIAKKKSGQEETTRFTIKSP